MNRPTPEDQNAASPGPAYQSPESPSLASAAPKTEHDPEGVDVALRIAHEVAGILPPPKTAPKPRRRRQVEQAQLSGSGPDARDPQPLGRAVNKFITARGWSTQLGLRAIVAQWADLVGPTNAAHSQPEAFSNGVLRVRAESTTWATALRTLAPQVVAKLNEALGEATVQRIDVHGPSAPSWKHGIRVVRDGRGPRDTYG